jgi:hypothetical protein
MAAALVCCAEEGRIVNHNPHAWFTYDGDHKLGESRWAMHLEGHWRRHDWGLKWQQLLLRPGITYSLNKLASVTAGYAFIETWPYGPYASGQAFTEHRLWEQLGLKYKTGKVAWSSRFRFENRWLESPPKDIRYENRIRLMQKFSVPINDRTYFTMFDEYWVFVPPFVSNSAFDQNRAYAAVGWRLAPHWNLETGYMHQGILRRSGLIFESNHTVRFTIVSNAPFH